MEHKDYIRIDDLEIYQIAMEIGDIVWDKVESWDWFGKQTLGTQVVLKLKHGQPKHCVGN